MPYTVNACFEKFRKDVVDLDPEQTKTARASRDFVYKNLESLSQKGLCDSIGVTKDVDLNLDA